MAVVNRIRAGIVIITRIVAIAWIVWICRVIWIGRIIGVSWVVAIRLLFIPSVVWGWIQTGTCIIDKTRKKDAVDVIQWFRLF